MIAGITATRFRTNSSNAQTHDLHKTGSRRGFGDVRRHNKKYDRMLANAAESHRLHQIRHDGGINADGELSASPMGDRIGTFGNVEDDELSAIEAGDDVLPQVGGSQISKRVHVTELRDKIFFAFDGIHGNTQIDPPWPIISLILIGITIFMVVISCVVLCVESLPQKTDDTAIFAIESVSIVWFVIDYFARFLTVRKKAVFVKKFLNLIDLVTILPYFLDLIVPSVFGKFAVFKVIRLVRVLKISKHSGGFSDLAKTFTKSTSALSLLSFLLTIAMLIFSSMMFFAEQTNQQWSPRHRIWVRVDGTYSPFQSILHCLWWCIVTLTTVGYGDAYPVTPLGKLTAGLTMMSGVLVIAFPTVILSAAFHDTFTKRLTDATLKRIRKNQIQSVAIAKKNYQQAQSKTQGAVFDASGGKHMAPVDDGMSMKSFEFRFLSFAQKRQQPPNIRSNLGSFRATPVAFPGIAVPSPTRADASSSNASPQPPNFVTESQNSFSGFGDAPSEQSQASPRHNAPTDSSANGSGARHTIHTSTSLNTSNASANSSPRNRVSVARGSSSSPKPPMAPPLTPLGTAPPAAAKRASVARDTSGSPESTIDPAFPMAVPTGGIRRSASLGEDDHPGRSPDKSKSGSVSLLSQSAGAGGFNTQDALAALQEKASEKLVNFNRITMDELLMQNEGEVIYPPKLQLQQIQGTNVVKGTVERGFLNSTTVTLSLVIDDDVYSSRMRKLANVQFGSDDVKSLRVAKIMKLKVKLNIQLDADPENQGSGPSLFSAQNQQFQNIFGEGPPSAAATPTGATANRRASQVSGMSMLSNMSSFRPAGSAIIRNGTTGDAQLPLLAPILSDEELTELRRLTLVTDTFENVMSSTVPLCILCPTPECFALLQKCFHCVVFTFEVQFQIPRLEVLSTKGIKAVRDRVPVRRRKTRHASKYFTKTRIGGSHSAGHDVVHTANGSEFGGSHSAVTVGSSSGRSGSLSKTKGPSEEHDDPQNTSRFMDRGEGFMNLSATVAGTGSGGRHDDENGKTSSSSEDTAAAAAAAAGVKKSSSNEASVADEDDATPSSLSGGHDVTTARPTPRDEAEEHPPSSTEPKTVHTPRAMTPTS